MGPGIDKNSFSSCRPEVKGSRLTVTKTVTGRTTVKEHEYIMSVLNGNIQRSSVFFSILLAAGNH